MKIENPFESGHIKNYILLYASVIVIVVLFFLATTLFDNDQKQIEKKSFDVNTTLIKEQKKIELEKEKEREKPRFKLLNKAY